MSVDARDRFLAALRTAIADGSLVKLTLGKYRGPDATLRNLFVRPVALKSGPHLAFVWRHATRDVTKNFPRDAAAAELESLVGGAFLDAHLFTLAQAFQFESQSDGSARLHTKTTQPVSAQSSAQPGDRHDAAKHYLVPNDAPWLRALGVVNDRGQPREGMADKFRQIQKFAELLTHLLDEAKLPAAGATAEVPLEVVDMGSGKGYLTFAVASLLGDRARVMGIEARPELVALCNRVAAETGLAPRLQFRAGTIATTPLPACDVLIALHACDTATDDALAQGVAAGARLLVVAPCCQKELRRQLQSPAVLAGALRHGIFQERHAEFATDALRALLLEWAGYQTKVFEFISTEHTAKNLMIAAIKVRARGLPGDPAHAAVQALAAFYGVRTQALARHLGVELVTKPV